MKNHLEKIKAHEIFNMVQFVVTENFKHHVCSTLPQDYTSEVNAVYDEELTYYNNSEVFVARDPQGSILGSIRVLKWNYIDTLPLQKIFNINPLSCIDTGSVNEIYHIGRFAIQKGVPSMQLFKQLIARVITRVCEHRKNVAFAECDGKLLRILSLLGIKTKVIGKPLNYLGSETIPVLLTYDGLITFYKGYMKLFGSKIMTPQKEDYLEQLAI